MTKLKSLGDNPARVVNETTVQANGLVVDGHRFSGDVVRFQTENLPSLVEKGVKNRRSGARGRLGPRPPCGFFV